MRYKIVFCATLLVIAVTLAIGQRAKSNIKVSHIGPNTVGITCLNGGDPTGNKYGDVLIIDCGK